MTAILVDENVMVPMRDGVRLATDVRRLDGAAPGPALVVRTPYDKGRLSADTLLFDLERAVRAGYVVVTQDVRGRYRSEGSFDPHVQEEADGIDAFAWAAAQPWSDGTLGTFGPSYMGAAQWLPARRQPPALRAMAPSFTFSDSYEGCSYQGGAKVLHDLRWAVADIVPAEVARRRARGELASGEEVALPDVDEALGELPLASHPAIGEYAGFYRDWLAHPTADDHWRRSAPCAGYDRILVPALNISGWYDIFLWSTFQNHLGMTRHGATGDARRHQRLVIGPWSHTNLTGRFPERDFGPGASAADIDLAGIQLRWFDRWLRGGPADGPPVLIFVMGADEWRAEDEWPLPDTEYRSFHLRSGGAANTRHGDGGLSPEPPGDEPADRFGFDPLDPVPTVGGQVILPGRNAIGPRDQAVVEDREDVLVYTTPVLDRAVEVTGPVELVLFVSSSAPDTDLTSKLVDVGPDGRAMILTEGILRARYRRSATEPELLEPGAVHELRLNLWATSNVFLPGHRIRLEVSSSNFPRFDRNSNTGGVIATEAADRYRTAENRVHHDAAHPSRLVLPVIDRARPHVGT
ncbi:MAG: CocE/NonD family hydrolase [Actinomycetota bacterium]|nr:CocE/NonD family hydrolase [Actinomycetota bacterium]